MFRYAPNVLVCETALIRDKNGFVQKALLST